MNESRKSATPPKAESDKERPQRGPEPDTLEGPGGHEEKREDEARNKAMRRGEH